jgi:hypothetical protein
MKALGIGLPAGMLWCARGQSPNPGTMWARGP